VLVGVLVNVMRGEIKLNEEWKRARELYRYVRQFEDYIEEKLN